MAHQIHQEIATDIGPLLSQLAKLGYEATGSLYDSKSFGNYSVDLVFDKNWLRIVRDRSQYSVDVASKEQLREAGMLRAFEDRGAFERAVLEWLPRSLTSA